MMANSRLCFTLAGLVLALPGCGADGPPTDPIVFYECNVVESGLEIWGADTVSLFPGDTAQFLLLDDHQVEYISPRPDAAWSSSDTAIARVYNDGAIGIVSAIAPGVAEICASVPGEAVAATVVVRPPPTADTSLIVMTRRLVDHPYPDAVGYTLIRADGSDRRDLAGGGSGYGRPAISNDGRYLAYHSNYEAPDLSAWLGDIIVESVSSGLRTTIDHFPTERDPTFDPSGETLAFVADGDIVVAPLSGGAPTTVALNGSSPAWSPDGETILFQRGKAVYTVRPDGAGEVLLAEFDFGVGTFDWSPDGRQLLFTGYPNGPAFTDSEIYLMNVDGTGLQRLTTRAGVDFDPSWSPDGTRFVFRRDDEIGFMTPGDPTFTPLTTVSGYSSPAWAKGG